MKTAKLPISTRPTTAELNGPADPAAKPPAKRRSVATVVDIPQLRVQTAEIEIVGISPLIVHAWSSKAIKMMLDKQLGVASSGREKRNPLQDFKDSLYYLPDDKGFGIPSGAIKACLVSAANDVRLKMTEIKRALHVLGDLTAIIAPPLAEADYTSWDRQHQKDIKFHHDHGCQMRQDLCRLESGVADVRFRGCFPKWGAVVKLEFNEAVLSLAQITNLLSTGGYGVGLLEMRPSAPVCRSGSFGRFRLKSG